MSPVTDKIFLSVVLILVGFGIVMVYSTSGVQAETQGNGHYFLMRHLLSILQRASSMNTSDLSLRGIWFIALDSLKAWFSLTFEGDTNF